MVDADQPWKDAVAAHDADAFLTPDSRAVLHAYFGGDGRIVLPFADQSVAWVSDGEYIRLNSLAHGLDSTPTDDPVELSAWHADEFETFIELLRVLRVGVAAQKDPDAIGRVMRNRLDLPADADTTTDETTITDAN